MNNERDERLFGLGGTAAGRMREWILISTVGRRMLLDSRGGSRARRHRSSSARAPAAILRSSSGWNAPKRVRGS